MTTLTIPANDHGKMRVFALAGPVPAGLMAKDADALENAFGTASLNPDYVDVVDIAALDDMSLHDLMVHGYDITPDPVDRAALDAITDHAVLIMSRATDGAETTLTLAPGITHVTTCGDAAQLTAPQSIPSDATQGIIADPPSKKRSDAAMSGRVATIALIVMFAVFGLMIWIGG